jgi:aspartyl-tRNA(Asn)/glutamyl-tRNA(Gln) amidotransferase subunit A
MDANRLIDGSISDMAAALRRGQVRSEALVDAVEARHGPVGRPLNAYKTWDGKGARLAAKAADAAFAAGVDTGLLQGVPVSIKDIYGVQGLPTFAGSPKRLPEKWQTEGPVVRAVKQAHAIVTGKTHTVEFAFGGIGTNPHGGTPRNPWDATTPRVCGGSSSGAGVSLAWGAAAIALGTDTGGSVRVPAAFTGNAGIKVTIGRWSTQGIVPLSTTYDTPGPLARSVEDAAIAFGTIDPRWRDGAACLAHLSGAELSSLTFGICDEYFWGDCGPGVAEAVKRALDELVKKGARLVKVAYPEAADSHQCFVKGALFGVEGVAFLERELPDWIATVDPNVAARHEVARRADGISYFTQLRRSEELAAAANDRLQKIDALVTPTVAITAPSFDDVANPENYARLNGLSTRNTRAINLLRQCAVSVPVGLDGRGLPIGMQIVCGYMQDERAIAVALAAERALGRARSRLGTPPMCRA